MFGGQYKVHMPIARAAIKLVGSKGGAHELLKQIQLFIGTSGRHEAGNGVGTVLLFDCHESINKPVHGFQPRLFNQAPTFTNQGVHKPTLTIQRLEAKPPPHTQPPVPFGRIGSITPLIFPGQW